MFLIINLLISLVKFQTTNTYVAAKNGRTVKQSHFESLVTWKLSQYLSDVTGSPTVKSVTCGCFVDTIRFGFAMGIRTNIHGSVAFPVLLLIDKENPHHYWNVVYR